MKKTFLLLVLGFSSLMAFAQPKVIDANRLSQKDVRTMIPKDIDPFSLQRKFDLRLLEQLVPESASKTAKAPKPVSVRKLQNVEGTPDTISYFAVAQSFMLNYVFNYMGGDIETYNVDMTVEGSKVTLNNLFNLYDSTSWSPNIEYPLVGTYNEINKTISIPTSTTFSNATIAGYIYGYYQGVLMSGTVNEDGKLSPVDSLVFNVEGDFDRIYTNQNFGVAMYSPDGTTSYGMVKFYRSFAFNKPSASSKLITFNDFIDYGEDFPNTPITKSFTIVNTGNNPTDFVMSVESDDDAFQAITESGTIEAQSKLELGLTFSANNTGEYEGLAVIEYEDGEPLMLQMSGVVKPFPDYQSIVTTGTYDFATNIEYPFMMTTMADGTPAAKSTTNGLAGTSKLDVMFNVPEGKLAKFSWNGQSSNSGYWYSAAAGYFVDDMNTAVASYSNASDDISNTIELAPGEHVVRFQYDQYYIGSTLDGLSIYNLNMNLDDLKADTATLVTPYINLGNLIIKDGVASANGTILLCNKGSNSLRLLSTSSDNQDITVDQTAPSVPVLKNMEVPFTFAGTTVGKIETTVTLVTNAGTFNAKIIANVLDMPNFSSIVTEGAEYITSYTTNEANPFIVDNGLAYNLNSSEVDTVATESSFSIAITIPEGKVGRLLWDGYSYGTSMSDSAYWNRDYAGFDVHHPKNSGMRSVYGTVDASADSAFLADSFWADFLVFVPGEHSIDFKYFQGGDKVVIGKNRLEISNIRLLVSDYNEYNGELITTKAIFDSTYVGPNRYTKANVTLHNIGSKELSVDSISHVGPFYGVVPTTSIAYNKTMEVELWFYPTEEGEFADSITIYTTGGNFKVACEGKTKTMEGIIYAGDFEDDATNWTVYDEDKDGETWDLGTNLWGDEPRYVHSGHQCLASISYSNYLGSITPNNWTFSPMITIPSEGAMLSYYVSAFSPTRYAEHYSLYIAEEGKTIDDIKLMSPAIDETVAVSPEQNADGYVDGWLNRTVDLTPYAGKVISLAFNHGSCTGQYILRLDDVFIYNTNTTAISNLSESEGDEEVIAIYDISGVKIDKIGKGLNILRIKKQDGTIKTVKILK